MPPKKSAAPKRKSDAGGSEESPAKTQTKGKKAKKGAAGEDGAEEIEPIDEEVVRALDHAASQRSAEELKEFRRTTFKQQLPSSTRYVIFLTNGDQGDIATLIAAFPSNLSLIPSLVDGIADFGPLPEDLASWELFTEKIKGKGKGGKNALPQYKTLTLEEFKKNRPEDEIQFADGILLKEKVLEKLSEIDPSEEENDYRTTNEGAWGIISAALHQFFRPASAEEIKQANKLWGGAVAEDDKKEGASAEPSASAAASAAAAAPAASD